ncbi:MAG: sigma-54-dependent Fis family transcriptional regulator [Rhodocyclaceae bacterium]|nr:sigma-54-dependent Fis family transcriptional regulator [Rhodocyclaceae bacterium]
MNDLPRKPLLLVVDDDPLITDSLAYYMGGDFHVITAASRNECRERLRSLIVPPQLALIDLGLPPAPHRPDEGFALIGDLLAHVPGLRIIVLSGQNDEANARHARTLGAFDFVAKPADPERLRQTLARALAFSGPDTTPEVPHHDSDLVGASPAVEKLRQQAHQYADSPFPVLIEGESGSGKEIVASDCLHKQTRRRDRPYLALNCAAISPTLVEPTLFGYAKGAFTGASQAKSGYFEDAADGTLFLDEIGELPLDLQPKLLRVLENGEFQRVGETQTRHSQARVIAATNRDLRREVREGRFRADLYHRLSVFTITVPPLRDMGTDRLLLLDHYRQQYSRQAGQAPFQLAPDAETCWLAYEFPGNVRELRNIVIRLTAKYPGQTVSRIALEAELETAPNTLSTTTGLPPEDPEDLARIALQQLQGRDGFSLDETLRRWEQAYISAAQQLAHGNMSQAAKLLGIHRTTLYNRLETLSRAKNSPKES